MKGNRQKSDQFSENSIRVGFTTSACASAAAAAAVKALITKTNITEISIDLPSVKNVSFPIHYCEIGESRALCSVIKDSGDDAFDATHGIEIKASAVWQDKMGIELKGGTGVGKVTLPGLPLPVGEAAINPMPRRIILDSVQAVLAYYGKNVEEGVCITIEVPEGEKIAGKTMNPELGIIGGISILGTDGIQRPFSQPSYRASVYYGLKVSRLKGCEEVGISSGRRSLTALQKQIQPSDKIYFIEVGDEIGYALSQAARLGYKKGYIGIMPGKLSKLAQGRMQTHIDFGKVDFEFLSEVAESIGISQTIVNDILKAKTVHYVLSKLSSIEKMKLLQKLAERAASFCTKAALNRMEIKMYVFSIKGECYLSSYQEEEMSA